MASANDPRTGDTSAGDTSPDLTGIQSRPAAPVGNTAIQATTPPSDAGRIPLPPPPVPRPRGMTDETLARLLRGMDVALVIVVLALTFLVASFAVRNSDFWMSLATGRLLAQGKYSFGTDPFAYTTQGVFWVNHSWLYSLLLYWVYQGLGGAAVVVLKALACTALAWMLLNIRRPGTSLWLPGVFTALAVLAMTPRLLMQPAIVSYLFLGLTLYLLHARPQLAKPDKKNRAPQPARWVPQWLLVPLFVLWVNLDGWFLFGPLTVGLYLLGVGLQEFVAPLNSGPDAPYPGERRRLALIGVVATAACLLNPHHVHAFTLPVQFSQDLADVLKQDPYFEPIYTSPLEFGDFFRAGLGKNVCGITYFILLIAGVLSFVVNSAGFRWWRATIFTAFTLLSFHQARAIPFFAIVAGPIAALNWQDYAARTFGPGLGKSENWKQWLLAGRFLTLLAGAVLLAVAWPGWLVAWYGSPNTVRRVAWTVEADPSLQRAAEHLGHLRQEGRLRPEDHGFNFVPDAANYFAWFCPDEKGFFDYRFQLFPELAKAYVEARRGLKGQALQQALPGQPAAPAETTWQDVFRKHHINHVVVSGPGQGGLPQALTNLLADPKDQWTLAYLDGRTAIFAWKDSQDPAAARAVQGLALDLDALAFGPKAVPAPAQGPGRSPVRPDFWALYGKGSPPVPLDAEAAGMYLTYFRAQGARAQQEHTRLLPYFFSGQQVAVSATGLGLPPGPLGAAIVPASLARNLHHRAFANVYAQEFVSGRDDGPPAAAFLALRATRRAIAASPDNAEGYGNLAYAYLSLSGETRERKAYGPLPRLAELRQTQLLVALHQALGLQPDSSLLHQSLAGLYRELRYYDVAKQHREQALRLRLKAGPLPGQDEGEFKKEAAAIEDELKGLDNDLRDRRNKYELAAANRPPKDKADLALQLGLAEQALMALLDSDVIQFGQEGALLQLELLLRLGRLNTWLTADRREYPGLRELIATTPEIKGNLGEDLQWLLIRLAAATGDYAEADKHLQELVQRGAESARAENILPFVGRLWIETLEPKPLAYQVMAPLRGDVPQVNRWLMIDIMSTEVARWVGAQADFTTLRGLLALEQGDTVRARELFRQALRLTLPPRYYGPFLAPLGTASPLEAAAVMGAALNDGPPAMLVSAGRAVTVRYLELLDAAARE